jgi:hypothetical protein
MKEMLSVCTLILLVFNQIVVAVEPLVEEMVEGSPSVEIISNTLGVSEPTNPASGDTDEVVIDGESPSDQPKEDQVIEDQQQSS